MAVARVWEAAERVKAERVVDAVVRVVVAVFWRAVAAAARAVAVAVKAGMGRTRPGACGWLWCRNSDRRPWGAACTHTSDLSTCHSKGKHAS